MTIADRNEPRGSWRLIVDALAALGNAEIERRQRAAQAQIDAQHDDRAGAQPSRGEAQRAAQPEVDHDCH